MRRGVTSPSMAIGSSGGGDDSGAPVQDGFIDPRRSSLDMRYACLGALLALPLAFPRFAVTLDLALERVAGIAIRGGYYAER